MGLDSNLSCTRSLAPTSSGVVGGGKLPDLLCTYSDRVRLESLLCQKSGSDLLWGGGGRKLPHSLCTYPDGVGLESLLCQKSGSDLLWGGGGREVT